MAFVSVNPATGRRIVSHRADSRPAAARKLELAHDAFGTWRKTSFAEHARLLRSVARGLRHSVDELAVQITTEMGKPVAQSRAEIEKSARVCEHYAKHAASWLAPERPPGAPKNAEVWFEPLGVVLAVMPWNFPVWQTMRAVAPTLMAGNTLLLKPAPGTAGTTLSLEKILGNAGLPAGVFQTLLVEPPAVAVLIADPRVAGVTLTGSTRAGKSVAAAAGAAMKPGVFELGGSDAYLILDDADLDLAAHVCAQSRLINSGQSCIAAKRFIVANRVRREFEKRLVAWMAAAVVGDPLAPATTVGPLARADLRDQLHRQVEGSVRRGARILLGGEPRRGPGFYYPPTVLTGVRPGMPAYHEELFGPVAAVITARDDAAAIAVANDTIYGLAGGVFSRNRRRARRVAAELATGFVAINDFARSDPALPFGGVKQSGHGRELGEWGARAFVNVKTVCG